MSFVYAVNDIEFLIMSDTKISFSDRLSCWNSDFERKLVEQLGLIKSIIVSPNMVVCYAGNNIDGAAKLLREIKLVGYNLEKTIERAFQIHKEDKVDAIEFIIGYSSKNKKELVSIKNGQIIRGCKIAWLGSWDAYNQFKSMESTMVLDEQIQLKSELIQWEQYKEGMERICALETIFRTIVKSGVDPTVGGMMVRVKWQETTETFEYMSEFSSMSSSWPQTIKSGDTIKFYQGPEKGSYCCNVYQSNKNFCCYIYEACMGIVYTDEEVYDEHLAGMKFPKLYKVCVEEFDDIAQSNGAQACVSLG